MRASNFLNCFADITGGSVYCATKFALDAFSTASRHDLVGTKIRVTAVSPGTSIIRFVLPFDLDGTLRDNCIL